MSTGWEIGKEAREALRKAMRGGDMGLRTRLHDVLDRCTDADDVAECRQLLTDDDGSQQGAQEPRPGLVDAVNNVIGWPRFSEDDIGELISVVQGAEQEKQG